MSLVHNTLTPDIETAGEDYARRFQGAIGRHFLTVQARGVAQLLEQLSPGPLRILEVGGGHTQLTPMLLAAGHTVTVQGSAASALIRCDALQAAYSNRLEKVVSNLWRIPFRDRSFDVVIAVRLLAHVERWQELLQEMARLAERAIIVDFAVKSGLNLLTPALFGVKRKIEGNTRPYFSYSPSHIRFVMESCGFDSAAQQRQFFLPMGLHRALKSVPISSGLERLAALGGLTPLFGSPAINLYIRSPKSL